MARSFRTTVLAGMLSFFALTGFSCGSKSGSDIQTPQTAQTEQAAPQGDPNATDESVKIYAADDEGIQQCQNDHPEQAQECQTALSSSRDEHESTAQHYTLNDCIAQYGAQACVPRDSGSYYVPVMAGFMFGVVVGSPVVYHPVYVNLSGRAYYGTTVLGTYRGGSSVAYVTPARGSVWVRSYNVRTVSVPRSMPVTPPSYNAGPHIERGRAGAGSAIATTPAMVPPRPSTAPQIVRGSAGTGAAITRAPSPSAPSISHSSPSISRGGAGGASSSSSSNG